MLITAKRLFDGRGESLLEDPLIEVLDGQIVEVTQRRASTDDSDLVDLGDVTLMPGLIDVHQHLAFDASDDPVARLLEDDDATLLLRMRVAALRAVAGGVTTIRDLGDRNYVSLTLRDWFRTGAEVGPEILTSGPPITVTRGHCWFLGGEADGADAIGQAVRDRASRGVDVIKIMATGGNMTPTVGAARIAVHRRRTSRGGHRRARSGTPDCGSRARRPGRCRCHDRRGGQHRTLHVLHGRRCRS